MNEAKPDILSVMEREGLKLRRAGKSYRGKCPMHDGKSHGSLTVYPDSQSWYCWGCGEGGDVIDFIMKLKGYSFKDACRYFNIIPGKPAPVDPAIERKKQIQRDYETAIHNLYEGLCQQARYLHKLRINVKENPGALTEAGAVVFAQQMRGLAEIDYKIDTILEGEFEDQMSLLKENRKNENATNSRAA
jgi:hypothetical protein